MMEDLAEAVRACDDANGHAPLPDTELNLRVFIKRHHAEIAEALRAVAYGRALMDAMNLEYQAAKEASRTCAPRQAPWVTTYSLLHRIKVAANNLVDAQHDSAWEG